MTIEAPAPPVTLRPIEYGDREEFPAMVRESRDLHRPGAHPPERAAGEGLLGRVRASRALPRPWAYPPERADQFDELVARSRRDDVVTLLACRAGDGGTVGGFTTSQTARGRV